MRRHVSILSDHGQARAAERIDRSAVATVELALCLPLLVILMLGAWEVGRVAQVSNILSNGVREAARDASMGQDTLQTIAANQLSYLQSALPSAFIQGHSTIIQAPVVSLPANTTGYTCWDNTANQELFTITFTDITQSSITDPTGMSKLDHYQIGIQVPYAAVGWTTLEQITGVARITVTVDWASMRDTPFQISPVLPAQ